MHLIVQLNAEICAAHLSPRGPDVHRRDKPYGTCPGNATLRETSTYQGLIAVISVMEWAALNEDERQLCSD